MDCCEPKPEKKIPIYSFFRLMVLLSVGLYAGHVLNSQLIHSNKKITHVMHSFFDLMNTMSWGIALGVVFVGLLAFVPREYILSILGKPGSKKGIVRATLAGVLLDLCNHGILMVGMKLYQKGASIGQVMAFLIASPWNSLSLTFVLVALIGLKWTLVFILLSAVIALLSGIIFDGLVKTKILPPNPHQIDLDPNFQWWPRLKHDLRAYQFQSKDLWIMLKHGINDSKMVVQWIVFGALLSSLIKTYVPQDFFAHYFGPSLLGLGATLLATTVIEVCSEGAAPVAADFISRAAAPGNSFTFLMAGVSTDYTEIMALKETTHSWKIALFLPLVTVPQVLILGYLLNQ